MTVTDQVDAKLAPIIVALNKLRQIRDSIPMSVLALVPVALRAALDEVFAIVAEYDRLRGLELEARKRDQASEATQKENDPQGQ